MTEKKTETAGAVLLNAEGLVAVVSQHGTSWSLPKGHVDPGEDLLAAAKREVLEETGIDDITLIKKLGTYERYRIGKDPRFDDTTELKSITLYLFKTDQKELCPQDKENPEACWVKKEDVAQMLTNKKDADFFESIKGEF